MAVFRVEKTAAALPDNPYINKHFAGIGGEAASSHLLHFLLNQCPFLCGHGDTQHNAPRSVCHSFTVLSVSNKGLGLSQQAMPRQGLFRECGYTPYACCGISFLTTTVNTLHFSKPIRKSSRTIHAGFLKNCGYSYIIYIVLLCLSERSGV